MDFIAAIAKGRVLAEERAKMAERMLPRRSARIVVPPESSDSDLDEDDTAMERA